MKTFKEKLKDKTDKIREDFNVLTGIGDFFKGILNLILKLDKILLWILKTIVWFFNFLTYMAFEVFNPAVVIRDIVELSFNIPEKLIKAFQNLIHNMAKLITNNIVQPLFKNIFGWDSQKDTKNKDCYKTEKNEVSLQLIISTILLPPLGIFMKFGLRKWTEIMISGSLTLLFYFPGLIFSLVKIYT